MISAIVLNIFSFYNYLPSQKPDNSFEVMDIAVK